MSEASLKLHTICILPTVSFFMVEESFVQWLKSHQENIVRNEYLRYDMHTLDELKKVVNVRESELAMKEDLLANQEKEIFALRTQMEDQIAQLERSEYERSSEQARRRQLEEAEKDIVRNICSNLYFYCSV